MSSSMCCQNNEMKEGEHGIEKNKIFWSRRKITNVKLTTISFANIVIVQESEYKLVLEGERVYLLAISHRHLIIVYSVCRHKKKEIERWHNEHLLTRIYCIIFIHWTRTENQIEESILRQFDSLARVQKHVAIDSIFDEFTLIWLLFMLTIITVQWQCYIQKLNYNHRPPYSLLTLESLPITLLLMWVWIY